MQAFICTQGGRLSPVLKRQKISQHHLQAPCTEDMQLPFHSIILTYLLLSGHLFIKRSSKNGYFYACCYLIMNLVKIEIMPQIYYFNNCHYCIVSNMQVEVYSFYYCYILGINDQGLYRVVGVSSKVQKLLSLMIGKFFILLFFSHRFLVF